MKITKTKTGKFTTVISLGKDDQGKQHTKRFTADSKAALKDAVAEYKTTVKVIRDTSRFGDALKAYISAREPHRSPTTIRGYNTILNALERSHRGLYDCKLDMIRDKTVQKVATDMKLAGKSEKYIRNTTGLINAVLIENGYPPAKLILPQRKVSDPEIPTIGEIKMMLCLVHGTKLDVPFQLSLLGMRRAEVCALESSDISPAGVAHIHQTMALTPENIWIIKDTPKTSASNRYIQLPAMLAARIREQGRATDMNPNAYTNAYSRFLKKYQFTQYRLHDCRHFFASYCHAQGIPEADILAAGGWRTSNVMKNVYRHSLAANRASSAMAAAFNL